MAPDADALITISAREGPPINRRVQLANLVNRRLWIAREGIRTFQFSIPFFDDSIFGPRIEARLLSESAVLDTCNMVGMCVEG